MKLIIGLGNPGDKYKNNRHNIGYKVADELKAQSSKLKTQSSKLKNILVAKTNIFMNESGEKVKHLVSQYPGISMSDLFIVHDDLDIKLSEYKIQKGKGPKDHKGLLSIYEALGTKDFWHVRVGVENRPDRKIAGEDYVLQNFTEEEKLIINKVINEICKKLATF